MRACRIGSVAALIFAVILVTAGLAQAQPAPQGGAPTGRRPFESVREIIPSPLFPHDNTLFAIVGRGDWPVLRSADGGVTWTPIRLAGLTALDLSFSQAYATDRTLYVALTRGGFGRTGHVLARSTDAGVTWTTSALPNTGAPVPYLAVAAIDARRLFVGQGGGIPGFDREKGLFYSDDGGQTWTRRLSGACTTSPSCPISHRITRCSWGRARTTSTAAPPNPRTADSPGSPATRACRSARMVEPPTSASLPTSLSITRYSYVARVYSIVPPMPARSGHASGQDPTHQVESTIMSYPRAIRKITRSGWRATPKAAWSAMTRAQPGSPSRISR